MSFCRKIVKLFDFYFLLNFGIRIFLYTPVLSYYCAAILIGSNTRLARLSVRPSGTGSELENRNVQENQRCERFSARAGVGGVPVLSSQCQ